MPLMIQFLGPYACPKIVCDYCGHLIAEAKDGNYQWNHYAPDCNEGTLTPMYFTHMRCLDAFERLQPAPHGGGWIPLDALPHFLGKNLKVSAKVSRASAAMMA